MALWQGKSRRKPTGGRRVPSAGKRKFEIGGIRFAALGGSNPTIFDTPCELQEDEITKRLEAVSSNGMILMTHAPSYGILDHIPSGLSVGSKAIREIVRKY